MSYQDQSDERSPVFHERIKELKEHGYRGFRIVHSKDKWDGQKVLAKNKSGQTVTASGETGEEALKKLIDEIDYFTDEK